MNLPRAAASACIVSVLTGCAALPATSPCADISGTYVQASTPGGTHLSEVLAPDSMAGRTSSSVTVQAGPASQTIDVRFDGRRLELRRDTDYTCTDDGLRLVKPSVANLDLGEVFTDRNATYYVLSKASDGSLEARVLVQESATIGGVPLSGPERAAGSLRWKRAR